MQELNETGRERDEALRQCRAAEAQARDRLEEVEGARQSGREQGERHAEQHAEMEERAKVLEEVIESFHCSSSLF